MWCVIDSVSNIFHLAAAEGVTLYHAILRSFATVRTNIRDIRQRQISQQELGVLLQSSDSRLFAEGLVECLHYFPTCVVDTEDWFEFTDQRDSPVQIAQAGYYTAPHIDYVGVGTVIWMFQGLKRVCIWGKDAICSLLPYPDTKMGELLPPCEEVFLLGPGDCMYLPPGTRHSVLSLEDSLALTRSALSAVDLPWSVRHLQWDIERGPYKGLDWGTAYIKGILHWSSGLGEDDDKYDPQSLAAARDAVLYISSKMQSSGRMNPIVKEMVSSLKVKLNVSTVLSPPPVCWHKIPHGDCEHPEHPPKMRGMETSQAKKYVLFLGHRRRVCDSCFVFFTAFSYNTEKLY
jgi:hypothetical protein